MTNLSERLRTAADSEHYQGTALLMQEAAEFIEAPLTTDKLLRAMRAAADAFYKDDQPDCAGYLMRAVKAVENALPLEAITNLTPANFREPKSAMPGSAWANSTAEPNRYLHAQRPRGAEEMLAPASDGTGRRCGW